MLLYAQCRGQPVPASTMHKKNLTGCSQAEHHHHYLSKSQIAFVFSPVTCFVRKSTLSYHSDFFVCKIVMLFLEKLRAFESQNQKMGEIGRDHRVIRSKLPAQAGWSGNHLHLVLNLLYRKNELPGTGNVWELHHTIAQNDTWWVCQYFIWPWEKTPSSFDFTSLLTDFVLMVLRYSRVEMHHLTRKIKICQIDTAHAKNEYCIAFLKWLYLEDKFSLFFLNFF